MRSHLQQLALKKLRAKNFSPIDLANRSGVPLPTVYRFLNGPPSKPHQNNWGKLNSVLQITDAELYGEEESKPVTENHVAHEEVAGVLKTAKEAIDKIDKPLTRDQIVELYRLALEVGLDLPEEKLRKIIDAYQRTI